MEEQQKTSSSASLCISSETLTPEDISRILERAPSRSFLRGTPMSTLNPRSRTRSHHLWILDVSLPEGSELEAPVEVLLSFVESKEEPIRHLAKECTVELVYGYFLEGHQGGLVFPSELIARLAKFPMSLLIDVYA